jgi:hypothetical protein
LSSHLLNSAHWWNTGWRLHYVPVRNVLRVRSLKERGLGVESCKRSFLNDDSPFSMMQLEVMETILLLIFIILSVIVL